MTLQSPEVLHPAVTSKRDLLALRDQYPDASTWEWCPECAGEFIVPPYRESPCPGC